MDDFRSNPAPWRAAFATSIATLLMTAGGAALAQAPAAAVPASAPASAPADAKFDPVMVTARKREERGQDVPQSLNVFSGNGLEAAGVTSLEQLQQRAPGVAVVTGPVNQISIRGVSNNASQRGGGPSTAVHFDGVYLPRPAFALGEVFDLNRIEILKGPEGTLYGRNATAGVVNYVTRDPLPGARFDGFLGLGSDSLKRGQLGLNVASGEAGGFRISAAASRDDGYTENTEPAGGRIDGRDFQAARLKGVYQFSPTIEGRLTVQAVDDHGTLGYGISSNPATDNFVNSLMPPQRQSPRRIALDTPPDVGQHGTIVSAQVTADLGSGIQLKSITGHVNYRSNVLIDGDGTGGFIENSTTSDKSSFWSQEFQLSGGNPKGLSWTTGVYASREKTSGTSLIEDSSFYPVDLTPFTLFTLDYGATSRSAAVFGELTYAIDERWSVLAGARYTSEKISGDSSGEVIDFSTFLLEPFAGSESTKSSRFTPKLQLQYRPSKDVMTYAGITTGFKSGGINFSPPIVTYKPEKITAYEIGAKSLLMDGMLELEGAAFYYDYRDLQLRTVVGNQAPISNVSKAKVTGIEIAAVARPTRDFIFDFNAAYVDSELKDYISPGTGTDLSGMPLPLSPKWSGTAGAQYRFVFGGAGDLTARAEVNYQSSVIFPALQNPEIERRGAITLVNAYLRYAFADGRTWLSLIGRNLTDKTYLSNRNYSEGFVDLETYAAPRTFEVRVGTQF